MAQLVNQIVDVITTCASGNNHKLVPKVMNWNHRSYTFTKLGFRHPTRQGKRMIHVFDMADESHAFRLEFDAETLLWRLRYIAEGEP